eukprot:Gregarina_sp_Poly_1__7145@NODE_3914_length_826_cov_3_620553_g2530_i0_p2_GENE_NODE_3914_length_826_cov_3_620553_g2530_i0NODE_3914_length_826_cov_3_620553_g2530_i0_p2_ORF_typecomplete_len192_score27_46_NODE_3914_length_826_cov_3_620553_g2530_i080577
MADQSLERGTLILMQRRQRRDSPATAFNRSPTPALEQRFSRSMQAGVERTGHQLWRPKQGSRLGREAAASRLPLANRDCSRSPTEPNLRAPIRSRSVQSFSPLSLNMDDAQSERRDGQRLRPAVRSCSVRPKMNKRFQLQLESLKKMKDPGFRKVVCGQVITKKL